MSEILTPIIADKPWTYVGIDLIGPLPKTNAGNLHILTATDIFSKWVEALPLPNATSSSVIWGIEQMIYRHGCPEKILTDNGMAFCSKVIYD